MLRRLILITVLMAGAVVLIGGASSSPVSTPAEAQSCSAAYPDFCIPPPPPDLDCTSDVIAGRKNFTALAPDPHELDRDKNGVACEDAGQPRFATTTTAPTTTTVITTTTTVLVTTTTTLAGHPTTTTTTVRTAVPATPTRGAIALTG